MNFKTIAIAACIGYGLWFSAVGGKRVSEENVKELYRAYASAYLNADGKALCDLFRDDVHGKFSSTAKSMPVNEVVSKASACSAVDDFYRSKKRLEETAGHPLFMNIDYTVESITIAPDKQSALVQVQLEMRVGDEQKALVDMRSTQIDVVKRSFGKMQFAQSDGSVSFYR
ncbi:hypothetical protein [Hydrogenophaga sp. MI9]|uniref:hypothetical protein n=1 Tax=Hydrogenophaga sp. MI9 TaxID=3453719 RepID=UPI003EEE45AD